MTLLVAAFSSSAVDSQWGVHRIHERNLFYVAPLFFVLLLVWLGQDRPRPARLTGVAVVLAVALPPLLPYHELAKSARRLEVLPVLPWWNSLIGQGSVALGVTIFAAVLALGFATAPRRVTRYFPVLVFLQLYIVSVAAGAQVQNAARDASRAGLGVERDWIDKAVPADQEVVALSAIHGPISFGDSSKLYRSWRRIWLNEFFNARVGRIFYLGRRLPYDLRDQRVRVSSRGPLVIARNSLPVRARYVLLAPGLMLRGKLVARDRRSGMSLYRVDGRLVLR
jgi:hypothetical protein